VYCAVFEVNYFDKLCVCFAQLLMLEVMLLGQLSVIALSTEYYYRELIAGFQNH